MTGDEPSGQLVGRCHECDRDGAGDLWVSHQNDFLGRCHECDMTVSHGGGAKEEELGDGFRRASAMLFRPARMRSMDETSANGSEHLLSRRWSQGRRPAA
jgi:hypothetical protein